MIEFDPDAPKCPACACVVVGGPSRKERGGQDAPGFPCDVALCLECGAVAAWQEGRMRPLTKAEKSLLPEHWAAEQIKAAQARVVAGMWG